jgi:hypothetical protein
MDTRWAILKSPTMGKTAEFEARKAHNSPFLPFSIFVLCSGRREAFDRRSHGQIDHSVYTNTESEVGKEASE